MKNLNFVFLMIFSSTSYAMSPGFKNAIDNAVEFKSLEEMLPDIFGVLFAVIAIYIIFFVGCEFIKQFIANRQKSNKNKDR